MDPLSEVLSLLKLQSYMSGGFDAGGDWSISFGPHDGIKVYAAVHGECWLVVEGVADPVRVRAGDCFVLPRGRAFVVTSDVSLAPVDIFSIVSGPKDGRINTYQGGGDFLSVGGHFALSGDYANDLLGILPPIVHIREEADKAELRRCIEGMRQELRNPRPGSFLIAQQQATMMLVLALRLHLADATGGVGWLFALADKQMAKAITAMHGDPAGRWTLQSLAERARHVAHKLCAALQGDGRDLAHGVSDALAHGGGRRPTAELQRARFRHRPVARLRVGKRLQHGVQASHGLFATAIRAG